MELNNVNCIILSGVLAITLLTYLVTGCIILALGGISGPESGYNIMCRCANSRPVHVVLQIIAFGALINGYDCNDCSGFLSQAHVLVK